MPTQKRLMEGGDGETGGNDDTSHCLLKQPRLDGMDVEEAGKEEEEQAKPHPAPQQEMQDVVIGASERTDSDAVDAQVLLPEKPDINLHEIRKEVQCPICLGIIKRTRTMMECLHRFCRECIDKSMRLGNNECPACRTHCASRRSLRDDPRYDALIAALFPDIEKFEEEELAFHEEDKARNEQASIAQIYKRQSEALGKRPRRGSSGGGPSPSRSRKRSGETSTRRSNRRRRSKASSDAQESDDNDDITMAEALILSSATSEQSREITQQQPHHTSKVAGTSHSFSSATSSDGGLESSNSVQKKEKRGLYYGLMWNSEMRAWGKGGARSTARQSNANGSSPEKNGNRVRLDKLVNFLQSLDEEDKSTTSEAPAAGDGKADDVSEEVKKEHCIDSHDVQGTPQHFLPSMEAGKNHLSSAAAVRPCDSNNKSQQMPDMLKGKESFTSGFEANAISHGGQWIMAFQQKETS